MSFLFRSLPPKLSQITFHLQLSSLTASSEVYVVYLSVIYVPKSELPQELSSLPSVRS